MFTLIPSLYFLGVQYFRRSNISEEITTEIVEISPKPKVKTRRKKPHHNHRRRKTSISELNHDEMTYLIKETGFTHEKILLWYEEFLRDCPDGRLSKSKFIEIYQSYYKKGQVAKFCEYAFGLFNKDGSGYLDFIEFLQAVSVTSSKDSEQKMELFFSMYDRDHNSLIDANEMRDFVESIYDLMGIDISDPSRIDFKVQKIFTHAQCDQLGYLTKDQFAVACENDRHIRKLLISNTKFSPDQKT